MKIISFVNPNYQVGPQELNAYNLPYTAGILWSYIQGLDHLRDQFELGEFIWRRDSIDDVVKRIGSHDIVAFCTYVWNRNYNLKLAQLLREHNPSILIIFGGPEPPITDPNFFKKFPYIDICVKQEGEIALSRILEGKNLNNIPGLLINRNGDTIDTGSSERINDLSQLPSPYLTGVFDHLFKQHPEVTWNATLETNRGCPYSCTFCDWGSLTYAKIKKFDINRVFDELNWIGSHGCGFLSIADANFGIFTERDSLIADHLIEVQKKWGNPKNFSISWAKNQRRETLDIVKRFMQSNTNAGVNISVQSLNSEVLEIIKRNNMEINQIREMFTECDQQGIPLYTELILGLPGETLKSWRENFYGLYRVGNHTGITVFLAQLLENSEMNLLQKRLHGIRSIVARDYLIGANESDEIHEGIEVVVATKTMPAEDLIDAWEFSWFQNTFHINGLTNWVSRFLEKSGVDYEQFYQQLFEWLKTDSWWSSEKQRIRNHFSTWTKQGHIFHEPIAGIPIHGNNLIYSTIIRLHYENRLEETFNLIEKFMSDTWDLDADILQQLMQLQRHYVVNWHNLKNLPHSVNFNYNFLDHIQIGSELETNRTLKFDFLEDKNISLSQFVEQLFYSRRKNFGKTHITSVI